MERFCSVVYEFENFSDFDLTNGRRIVSWKK
jgi:hypothetical protein